MTYGVRCLVCGEEVKVNNIQNYVICDKCKSAILELRKKMSDDSSSKIYIIRVTDDLGNISYITKSPKMATKNSIESKIKVLKDKYINDMYRFSDNENKALSVTRTKANKICKSFYMLQENGHFNQFVKAEIIKDENVIFCYNFKKKEC